MVARAAAEALDGAGLGFDDVDGVFTNHMGEEGSVQLGQDLGIRHPRYSDSSDRGGGAFEAFVHHAALAIAAGRCEVALIGFASRPRTLRGRSLVHPTGSLGLDAPFPQPCAVPMPIGHDATLAARHMHRCGTTSVQLAEVAVAANRWAQLDPDARTGVVQGFGGFLSAAQTLVLARD